MNKIVTNIIILSLLGFGVMKLVSYQYDRSYYKKNLSQLSIKEQYKELDCLTENIYFEAAGEELAGKIAVGQVTMNRVKSKLFPDTICKVVHQNSQFSWVKDKPKRLVNINKRVYEDSREVAKKILFENEHIESLKDALFYHADYVNPTWAKSFIQVAKIGTHIFYKKKD